MQNESKKLKKALLSMFIVSLVLTVVFFVGFVLKEFFVSKENFGELLKETLKFVEAGFIYPFNKNHEYCIGTLFAIYNGNESEFLSVCISTYVAVGLTLALLVLGIVNCAVKKKKKFIWYIIEMIAALFAAVVVLNYGKMYYDFMTLELMLENATMVKAMSGLALIGGGLAAIATFVTCILGLIYIGRPQSASENSDEIDFAANEPVLAESAVTPEAVQEGEEIPAEQYVSEDEMKVEPDEVKAEEAPKVEEGKPTVNVNVEAPKAEPAIDQNNLASLLREVVRDIVRDELARSNANQQPSQQSVPNGTQQITGATFGGPLVVQYFNGGINGVTQPASGPVEQVVAPAPAPAPVEEVKEEVAPAPAPAPVEEKKEEKVYERLTFAERLLKSEKDVQDIYNELKNEILSYGVKSRVSANGDTFRLHKKMYVRITVAGKSLKLYFALDPKDYANSTIPVQDASGKALYEEIPLCFKVKSGLSIRRCKELIQAAMEQDGLEQGEVLKVNWIKELKAELAASKKE